MLRNACGNSSRSVFLQAHLSMKSRQSPRKKKSTPVAKKKTRHADRRMIGLTKSQRSPATKEKAGMRGPQDESIVAAQIAPRSEEGVVPQSLPGGKALVRVLQLLEA